MQYKHKYFFFYIKESSSEENNKGNKNRLDVMKIKCIKEIIWW